MKLWNSIQRIGNVATLSWLPKVAVPTNASRVVGDIANEWKHIQAPVLC